MDASHVATLLGKQNRSAVGYPTLQWRLESPQCISLRSFVDHFFGHLRFRNLGVKHFWGQDELRLYVFFGAGSWKSFALLSPLSGQSGACRWSICRAILGDSFHGLPVHRPSIEAPLSMCVRMNLSRGNPILPAFANAWRMASGMDRLR